MNVCLCAVLSWTDTFSVHSWILSVCDGWYNGIYGDLWVNNTSPERSDQSEHGFIWNNADSCWSTGCNAPSPAHTTSSPTEQQPTWVKSVLVLGFSPFKTTHSSLLHAILILQTAPQSCETGVLWCWKGLCGQNVSSSSGYSKNEVKTETQGPSDAMGNLFSP